MAENKIVKIVSNEKFSLKEQLDEIDDIIKQAAWAGYYWSRLNILMGKWEKGKVVAVYRGVNTAISYRQLGEESRRNREDLKQWHDLYENYPDREKYIEEYAKPRAEEWTKKALTSSVHFLSESSEWTTPEIIIKKTIQLLGEIDLDPCSNPGFPNVPAKNHFEKKDDGLSKNWFGKVYMNPPYGDIIKKWIEKVCIEYEKDNIKEAIVLVPSRTDTKWFRRLINHPRCFIWGRLKFGDSGNSAPFPSMVVYLGKNTNGFIETFSVIGDIYGIVT